MFQPANSTIAEVYPGDVEWFALKPHRSLAACSVATIGCSGRWI